MLVNASKIRVTGLALAALALAACGKKDNGAADTTAASSTTTTMDTTAASSTAANNGNWSDANIFAVLDEANAGDSTTGSIAVSKGTSSAVRDFGRQMMRDHHNLRVQGAALAKKLNVTPTPPSDDPLAGDIQKAGDNLNSTAKGKDFDKAYIDGEVDMHKKVLDLATKAGGMTQTTELKNLIQKAAPVIQGHLTKAENIQKNLK